MSDEQEREEYLQNQLDELDEDIRKLAVKMEEEMGISCEFGACVLNPELDTIEKKIEEVQRRKKMLDAMRSTLKECSTS